jgi:hypothetical protein
MSNEVRQAHPEPVIYAIVDKSGRVESWDQPEYKADLEASLRDDYDDSYRLIPLYAAPLVQPAPADLVLVPREPTDKMAVAGLTAWSKPAISSQANRAAACYRAMLAAAPSGVPQDSARGDHE